LFKARKAEEEQYAGKNLVHVGRGEEVTLISKISVCALTKHTI
jgi:hypothetical protein